MKSIDFADPTRLDLDEESSEDLETKYFGNRSASDSFHVNLLEEEYKKLVFENDLDAVKITLVYYTETSPYWLLHEDGDSLQSGEDGDEHNETRRNGDDGDDHNRTGGNKNGHDQFHETMMGNIEEEDEVNPSASMPTGREEERPKPLNFTQWEGASGTPSIYSYLRSIGSSMSRMDGRVLRLKEDMGYVKTQLSTITSLLRTLCQARSPTPPPEPDSRRSPTPHRDPDSKRSPTPSCDPDSRRSLAPSWDLDSRRSPTPPPPPPPPPPRSPDSPMLSPPSLPLSSPPRSPDPPAPNTTTSSSPLPLLALETTTIPPTILLPPPNTTTTSDPFALIGMKLQTLDPLPPASSHSLVSGKSAQPSCKRKGVERYTPNNEPKKRLAKKEKNLAPSTQPKVGQPMEPKTKKMLKYPLSGVSTPIFQVRFTYNLAHDIPSDIFSEMMSWIADKNTDVDVRHNPYLPLSKKFFQELTEPSSWVECDVSS
ncbi:unnamed protein product [Citrullus colocynthis]|uniref:Uncharacterized protein n=1 Tax=Citrullus colocynthis TaxID=252529 RepID=A0ABP0XK61_9ROSI